MNLVMRIYKLTASLPKHELYGLNSQMQRASISIPSNIAEGSERTGKEFQRFCSISHGSAAELETQLIIAQALYSLDCNALIKETQEIQKMLHKLIQTTLS